MRLLLALLLLWSGTTAALAQDRHLALSTKLEAAIVDHPGLDGQVELSVSGTPVSEFIRALGVSHQLNLTLDPAVKGEVVNNFSNARVLDVLLYLCKSLELDVEVMGSIISLVPYRAPPAPPAPAPAIRAIEVIWSADSGLIDLDLRKDTLEMVARAINRASGANVVLAPGLEGRPVSVFVRRIPLASALEKLAFANALQLERSKDGTYLFRPVAPEPNAKGGNSGNAVKNTGNAVLVMEPREGDRLMVDALDTPIDQIIKEAAALLNKSYYLHEAVSTPVTFHLEQVGFDELLHHLLRGTPALSTFRDGVYLIGKRDLEGLRRTELVRLQNRPTKDVLPAIPEGIRKDVTIAEFVELNAFVLSGDDRRIQEVSAFLRQIDQVVPVVMIEVMIVDVNRNRTLNTGLKAGLGSSPTQSGGTVLPGVEYNMNSSTLNNLINSFNGFGVFNLGNVTPGFYLNIQALETDGMLKLRSTPQLSTLNGHEANLSIGQTEYYLEVRNDLIGTQNPTVTTSQTYKPIKADLSLKIMPLVSSEDMVTLEIEVNQSNFTTRIAQTAPPGSVERKFSSIIRARDRDMIVLGGLEERENSRSGSGLPFLSRIPVIKWFFGSRTATTRRTKLTIFIKPTIIY